MRVRRSVLSLIALLPLLLMGSAASGQQDVSAPQAWESPTIPIGGHGVLVFVSSGTLRCADVTHAIIGAVVRKGTVVDYLQILCAPAFRDQHGAWGWNPASAYRGGGLGNPQGGGRTRQTVCTQGYAVTGFMAVATQDDRYLQDFRFECAPIIGIKPDPLGRVVARPQQVDVSNAGRQWAGWVRVDGAITSGSGHFRYRIAANDNDDINLVGKSRPIHQGRCGNAASGLNLSVGGWFVAGGLGGVTNVIQVFRMYCRGGAVSG